MVLNYTFSNRKQPNVAERTAAILLGALEALGLVGHRRPSDGLEHGATILLD